LLDRHGERGSTFAYLAGTPPKRAVSVTIGVVSGLMRTGRVTDRAAHIALCLRHLPDNGYSAKLLESAFFRTDPIHDKEAPP
jgi:hypothetical protein